MRRGSAQRLRRAIEVGLVAVDGAVVVVLALVAHPASPPWTMIALFAAMVAVAENVTVLMPSSVAVSPGFMLVIAATTVLAARGLPGPTVILATGTVAAAGGLYADAARRRRWSVIVFNTAQLAMAGAAGAAAFVALAPRGLRGGASLLAAPVAVAVYAAVNVAVVLPYLAAKYDRPARDIWADMRPAVPNALAFGVLGVLVGRLYSQLGPVALPLLLVPAAIARAAFSAYLELHRAHEAVVAVFVRAVEAKDRYTAGHCERVATYASYIGEEMGFTHDRLERLRRAALLHDVGKLAVPSALLNKPGRLTPAEYEEVCRHNEVCIDMLEQVDFLRSTIPVASDRHSRYGVSGRTDPEALEGYAVAVADAFDAMTSTRAYRRALPQEVAFAELRDKAGTQFHPGSVEALIRSIERRGEVFGLGHEATPVAFEVEPPVAGVGSAGLGDLVREVGGQECTP